MTKYKNLEYKIIDESVYYGEGHIINIAKRHTNRRWRQYTPEKQCNIELQLKKLCVIHSIELKGFGTYIIEISFKDENKTLVTQLKYNLNFEEEDINQSIICEQSVRYVDLKLINNEANPRRMGINHFFMKGETIKHNGEESDDENKKKKKKSNPSEIWVRQKTQYDPWGLNEAEQVEEQQPQPKQPESSTKSKSKAPKTEFKKEVPLKPPNHPLKSFVQSSNIQNLKLLHEKSFKRQEPSKSLVKDETLPKMDSIQQISKAKKKNKGNESMAVQIEDIQLEISPKSNSLNQNDRKVYSSSKRFEEKFNLKKIPTPQTKEAETKDLQFETSKSHLSAEKSQINQEEKKRAKIELIKRLQEKMKGTKPKAIQKT